ncbi:hypothetical protein JCM5353_008688 [Sporobolomyces roseus]
MASHQQLLDSIQTPRHPTFVGKYRTLLNMVDAVANMFDSSKLRRKEQEALEFWTSQAKSALGCAIDTISRPHGKKEGEMRFAGREYVELESYLEWLKAHSGPGRTFNTAHSLPVIDSLSGGESLSRDVKNVRNHPSQRYASLMARFAERKYKMLDFVTWCENEGWIQFGDYLVHGLCLYWGSYPVKFECEILNELVNISAFSITEEWTLETFWTKIKQAFESVEHGSAECDYPAIAKALFSAKSASFPFPPLGKAHSVRRYDAWRGQMITFVR